eukprot:1190227-Prorocentrum_minimum.AAC.2
MLLELSYSWKDPQQGTSYMSDQQQKHEIRVCNTAYRRYRHQTSGHTHHLLHPVRYILCLLNTLFQTTCRGGGRPSERPINAACAFARALHTIQRSRASQVKHTKDFKNALYDATKHPYYYLVLRVLLCQYNGKGALNTPGTLPDPNTRIVMLRAGRMLHHGPARSSR